jgi:ADP-ribose pyrophosphatase YjhB (NUDIX family)
LYGCHTINKGSPNICRYFVILSIMTNTNEVHFEGKIAQKVIVANRGKVLLVQDPRGGHDIWELPGGRMNIDEEPRKGMQREFFEEMGVAIVVDQVVHMEQFIQGNENARAFVIVYQASLSDADAQFKFAEKEVSNVGWFTQEELNDLELYPEYKRALDVFFT